MAGIFTSSNSFTVTPHKVSVCVLLQLYASPSSIFHRLFPCQSSSISTRNLLGLFLVSVIKSSESAEEPKFDVIVSQLRIIFGSQNHAANDHLSSILSSFRSPDDLFVFFNDLRQLLDRIGSIALVDDPVFLDSSSDLGLFLRRCILAFDHLHFEGVARLLTNIRWHNRTTAAAPTPFYSRLLQNPSDEGAQIGGDLCVGLDTDCRLKHDEFIQPQVAGINGWTTTFLHSSWQLQGYLTSKADAIEKNGYTLSSNTFKHELKWLEMVAPELQRIHYLRYLNSFYRSDYPTALENLHRYFDYTAGVEGFDFTSAASVSPLHGSGKYEFGLFCLGLLHFHLKHRIPAIDIFTEAVRVSQQQSNDSSLANTISIICNLFSEPGFSCRVGRVERGGQSSLSIPQQLFLLLRRSLRRAERLNLCRLISSSHLGIAKFNLRHVQRPLFISGVVPSMKLKTCPVSVIKALNSSLNYLCNFESTASDGHFSSKWLRNLRSLNKSPIFSPWKNSTSPGFGFVALSDRIPPYLLHDFGASYLLRTTAWEIYGSASLARLNSYIHATCFTFSSSLDDAALSHTKLFQHMAVFNGPTSAIRALEKSFPAISNSRLELMKLQLLHDRALYSGDLTAAFKLCDDIGSMASPVFGVDVELKFQSMFRRARTLVSVGEFNKAAEIANSLFLTCYSLDMHMENPTLLLLLAEIYKKSGNVALGIPYALATLSYSESLNLDLLKASAILTLAELYILLGGRPCHGKLALRLVHGCFAELVGHGGLEVCARAYVLEAKCYLSDSSFPLVEKPEAVLDPLRKAAHMLQVLEFHEMAAEAFYLIATTCDRIFMEEEREIAAASFRLHILALQRSQEGRP